MLTESARRQLSILYSLQGIAPTGASYGELLQDWVHLHGEVSRATFQRDLNDLRRMGADIIADRGRYRLLNAREIEPAVEAWISAFEMLKRLESDEGLVEVSDDQLALL